MTGMDNEMVGKGTFGSGMGKGMVRFLWTLGMTCIKWTDGWGLHERLPFLDTAHLGEFWAAAVDGRGKPDIPKRILYDFEALKSFRICM